MKFYVRVRGLHAYFREDDYEMIFDWPRLPGGWIATQSAPQGVTIFELPRNWIAV